MGLVVGLVTPPYLASDPGLRGLGLCEVAEFRGDLFGAAHDAASAHRAYADFAATLRRNQGRRVRIIHTLRLARDGGQWPDHQAESRQKIWQSLVELEPELRPEWVDIEVEAFGAEGRGAFPAFDASGISLLVSHHQFSQVYSLAACREWLLRLEAMRPDGVKMALQADSLSACADIMVVAAEAAKRHACSGLFAMGSEGRPTRLVAPWLGSGLTYGTLSGAAIAPGQLNVAHLREGIEALRFFLPPAFRDLLQGEGASRAPSLVQWDRRDIETLLREAKAWLAGRG